MFKKYFVASLFFLAFMFVGVVTVSAAVDTDSIREVKNADELNADKLKVEKWDDEKLEKRLLKLGLTEEQIYSLNYETRVEIANTENAVKVISYSKQYKNFDEGTETDIPEGDFSTQSLSSDMYLQVVTVDLGNKNGHPYVKAIADYNWSNMPVWRLKDAFGISFSGGWYAESYSFTDYQYRCGTQVSGRCLDEGWYGTRHSYPNRVERLEGVGWKYDLRSDARDAKGTAVVYMLANEESKIRSTNYSQVKTEYGHDRYEANLSLGFTYKAAGISADITFGGEVSAYDTTSIYNPYLTW